MAQMTIDRASAAGPMAGRAGFAEAVRAEWVKFRTVRGTVISALATIATGVHGGLVFGFRTVRDYFEAAPADRADFDPMLLATVRPLSMAMIAAGVIGVLAVTSEYASGTIRVSAIAVPSRRRLYAAKAVVVGAVSLVVGQIAALETFLISQRVLAAANVPSLGFTGPETVRAVVGGGLCLTLTALLGVAVGFLMRVTAGAVAVTTLVTILPGMAPIFPDPVADLIGRYWPSSAGLRVAALRPDPDLLGPATGFALMCGYVAVLLVIALIVFRDRDV
jgi:hypothetical protein